MRKKSIRFKRMWVYKHFFQSKIEDVDKIEEEKQEADLKEEVETASTGQPVDYIKQPGQLVTMIVTI